MDYESEFRSFWNLVKKMREAQKEYFRNRSFDQLQVSKKLEKEVDASVFFLEKEFGEQRRMF